MFRKLTITQRLLGWFLLLALLPLVVVTWITYTISEQALRSEVIRNLNVVADAKARQIETYARERQRSMSMLADSPTVINALKQLERTYEQGGRLYSGYVALTQQLRPSFAAYIQQLNYDNIMLISTAGDPLFWVRQYGDINVNYTQAPYNETALGMSFNRAITLLDTEVSNFEYDTAFARTWAYIAAPVYDSGFVIGAVVIRLNNQEIYSVINDTRGLGNTGETMVGVHEADGLQVVAPLRHAPDAAFNLTLPLDDAAARSLQNAVRGVRGVEIGADYRGQEVIAVSRYLPSLRWGMVVKIDTAEAFAAIEQQRSVVYTIGGLMLVLVTLASLAVSRSISEPILHLTDVVRQLQRGNLAARATDIHNQDEIGELAAGFNEMAGQLGNQMTILEERIEERTHELKEALEEMAVARATAEQANRAKSVFLANMSHELRTPLNAVIGFAQVMERDSNLSAAQRGNLGIILRSGDHLLGLINDVLEMSRIEAGQAKLNLAPFDLAYLLQSLKEMFQLRAQTKHLQLLFELDASVPQYVNGDEGKLRQILINLLGNAIKFTEEGGVVLRMRYEDERLSFEIEDSGHGIDQHEMGRLFQPFVQARSGAKAQEGTGLGLAITRQFIRLMGGDITVKSQVGQGTLFQASVHLEQATAEDVQPQTIFRRVIGIDPGDTRDYRILVVDDVMENRLLLLKWLQAVGIHAREASNGQEAIDIWEVWEPQLIWLDIRMPVMDGYEAVKRIKSTIKGQATVVIALTASAFEHEQAIVLSAGCDDFVRKPVRETVFFEKMAQHLGMKFVYSDQQAASERAAESGELTSAALAAVSDEHRAKLRDAAFKIDMDKAKQVIGAIRQQHPALADSLEQLVDNFRFDQLQALLQ